MKRSPYVLSPRAQQRYNSRVDALPISTRCSHDHLYSTPHGQLHQDAFEERLHDNTVTPPPDAAAFRIDWPWFLKKLSRRDRGLALFLSLGHSGKAAAAKLDRKSTRLNSSHLGISYAVFCLKKKKKKT